MWNGIASGEGEASLNALTPVSSPNTGSVISFIYMEELHCHLFLCFTSVWPAGTTVFLLMAHSTM